MTHSKKTRRQQGKGTQRQAASGVVSRTPRRPSRRSLSLLYEEPLKASRIGPLFSAFPYPTKISPETIALFIASHTNPGDCVFDGFAGSGTTGVAALLCGAPTEAMRRETKRLGLKIRWGARRAVLWELGALGSFVARTLCNPPDPDEFRREAHRVLEDVERDLSWMYSARDPKGRLGSIRYVVWSDSVECPNCGKTATLWEGCARRSPARINPTFRCPHCSRKSVTANVRRVTKTAFDELTQRRITARVRKPVWVYGVTQNTGWSRPVDANDRSLLARIARTALPPGIPNAAIPWGDLHRSGYHQGISHLHHFYTRRNLIAFATLWQRVNESPLREALRFWLLSYNASHATIMTRIVAKEGQKDFVVTSSQPGVLYVSGLPVEKNLFSGLRRKLVTIHAAFKATRRADRLVDVRCGSSLETDVPDHSIDYVFTDPPFGGNIPYAEVNFINEAWLGQFTNSSQEVTISGTQGKDVSDYEALMAEAFREMRRVLKKKGRATVVFHSSSSLVWNALSRAYVKAGLGVEFASVLDKTQGSFKQVTTNGAVKGDPILLLKAKPNGDTGTRSPVLPVVENLLDRARGAEDSAERTPQRLYSRFVNHYLKSEQTVPLDADEFYRLIASQTKPEDANALHE